MQPQAYESGELAEKSSCQFENLACPPLLRLRNAVLKNIGPFDKLRLLSQITRRLHGRRHPPAPASCIVVLVAHASAAVTSYVPSPTIHSGAPARVGLIDAMTVGPG